MGEVGLTGELRPVSQMEQRVKECRRLGYTRILLPASARIAGSQEGLIRVQNLLEAVSTVAYD